jgi:hypothetical protein
VCPEPIEDHHLPLTKRGCQKVLDVSLEKASASVAPSTFDLLRVQDPLEQGCDEGVAEVMEGESLVGEPGLCQQRLVPPLVEVVTVCRVADAVREDEVVVAPPGGPQSHFA